MEIAIDLGQWSLDLSVIWFQIIKGKCNRHQNKQISISLKSTNLSTTQVIPHFTYIASNSFTFTSNLRIDIVIIITHLELCGRPSESHIAFRDYIHRISCGNSQRYREHEQHDEQQQRPRRSSAAHATRHSGAESQLRQSVCAARL